MQSVCRKFSSFVLSFISLDGAPKRCSGDHDFGMTTGKRTLDASLLPATPLSVATLAPQTGSFASPPHDGYAFALAKSRTCKNAYINVSPLADTGGLGDWEISERV